MKAVSLSILFMVFAHLYLVESVCEKEPKCEVCNDTTLICDNSGFLSTYDILAKVTRRNLQYIRITGSSLYELQPNLFGSCADDTTYRLDDLTHLDLSNNNITTIHGKTFHCTPNLRHLNLSHNAWYVDNHTRVFSNIKNIAVLDLTSTFADVGKNTSFQHITRLYWMLQNVMFPNMEYIYLGGNGLYAFPEEAQRALCMMKNLKVLDLSNNKLLNMNMINTAADLCTTKIETIKLNQNYLKYLRKHFLDSLSSFKTLKAVTLMHNHFACDCELKEFYNWLKNTTVPVRHREKLMCHTGPDGSRMNKAILDLKLEDLRCLQVSSDTPSSAKAAYVVLIITLVCICVALITVAVMKRQHIRSCFKRHLRVPTVSTLSSFKESQFGYSSVNQEPSVA